MSDTSSISQDLHDLLVSRAGKIVMKDQEGKDTSDPRAASLFSFKYTDGDVDWAMIQIGLFPKNELKLETDRDMPDPEMGPAEKKNWSKFLKNIRFNIAFPHRFSFDIRNFTKGDLSLQDRLRNSNVDKNDVGVTESKLHGTSRSSYQNFESARIIIRHKGSIQTEQHGARSRNIDAIFVENGQGERFRLPEGTTVNGARAYARHIKNGGQLHDDFSQHIGKIIKEMGDLKVFVRNMRGRQFEDIETKGMVEAAIDHYGSLHRDLFTIRGQRGYDQYKSLWQPEQILDEDEFDIEALKERFVKRVFDERMLDALPVVHRAYKTRKDQVAEEFEAWADEVTSGNADGDSSVFANSLDDAGNELDGDSQNEVLSNLFNENQFEYNYVDGKYWFESQEEIERAKDIMAQHDPDMEMPDMGVHNESYGRYASTTFDTEPTSHGVKEDFDDLSLLKQLSGLAK